MATDFFVALVEDGVPLSEPDVNIFAEKLRGRLDGEQEGFTVVSVAFLLAAGYPVYRALVKTERRRDGTIVDVFEQVGGPEVQLLVNGFCVATWMLRCDRLSAHTLYRDFDDIVHITALALLGTWEFHNEVICCTKWGDEKGSTIECCSAP